MSARLRGIAALLLATVTMCTLFFGTAPAAHADTTNEGIAFRYLVGKGFSDVQAAGVVGNLVQESNVNPTAVQSGGPGRGIAQWSVGDRWDDLVAYANQTSRSSYDLNLQLDFIWKELTTYSRFGIGELKAATTIYEATVAFQDNYEICGACNTSNRVTQAQRVYDANHGGTTVDAGPSAGGTAVISTPSGRVWMFAIQRDGTLKYRWTGDTGWGDWHAFSGSYRSVAATVDGQGRVFALTTTTTGTLRSATYDGTSWTWSSAISAGYDWANVAASTDDQGRVWMYATTSTPVDGVAGRLFYRHQNADGTWTSMAQLGTGDWEGVSSTVKDGQVWVFAGKGNDSGSYSHRIFYYKSTSAGVMSTSATEFGNGGWAGDVAASTDDIGRVWVFAPTTDGHLKYKYTGGASGWDGPGGTYGELGAGNWAGVSSGVKAGQLWVFATKTTGDLWYYKSVTGGWDRSETTVTDPADPGPWQ